MRIEGCDGTQGVKGGGMKQVNAVSHMIQNEDFNIISEMAVVNNDDVDETEIEGDHMPREDGIEDDTQVDTDETLFDKVQVPSTNIYVKYKNRRIHFESIIKE
ncbi:hypothetical protein QVD17_38981 [Tagetes erecta]|uniref:Uncharacterized protein n=1 Tax=Tagetes erecta TaxID=13708 RepID=A0AAD8JRH9_TARER|nr:hypothetical protein QVD17_38981 [Tagetes erecta]